MNDHDVEAYHIQDAIDKAYQRSPALGLAECDPEDL